MDQAEEAAVAAWSTYTAWAGATSSAPPRPHGAEAVAEGLAACGLGSFAISHLIDQQQAALRTVAFPEFWRQLLPFAQELRSNGTSQQLTSLGECLPHALSRLGDCIAHSRDVVCMLAAAVRECDSVASEFHSESCAWLLASAPVWFIELLWQYYERQLAQFEASAFDSANEDFSDEPMEGIVNGNEEVSASVSTTTRLLRALRYGAVCEEAYYGVIIDRLKAKLQMLAKGCYDRPILSRIHNWLQVAVLSFLQLLAPAAADDVHDHDDDVGMQETQTAIWLEQRRARLTQVVYEQLGLLRITELFDIIVDYPDSAPAMDDLKECLSNSKQFDRLALAFKAALQRRLLHPGAATVDILQQYISTIRALRTLDPTGVLLEAVGQPIKDYLRSRTDTIRCIVTMFTEGTVDGSGAGAGDSLLEELGRPVPHTDAEEDDFVYDIDSKEALQAALNWEPEPIEADPSRTSPSKRLADIIGMLVGIYGSKELFVNEYRTMLADKLLAKDDYDTDREIANLELLKLRFDDANMHSCEVMLKDMADSKRMNALIKAPATAPQIQTANISAMSSTIVSDLFWPPLPVEEVAMPPQVQSMLDTYAAKYHTIKTPRKLQWKSQLGSVKLELQFADGAAQFQVSSVHAAIILHFQERTQWSSVDLAAVMNLQPSVLRRKAMLWVNQGVLTEKRNGAAGDVVYEAVDKLPNADAAPTSEEDGSALSGAAEARLQHEMAVYESYVLGMLANFDALPLDRIHNMLKMFVVDPPYEKTSQQLAGFLAQMVKEDKLEHMDGMYRKRT
eukprot:jgi/Chlat1/7197/Chrsp57S06846